MYTYVYTHNLYSCVHRDAHTHTQHMYTQTTHTAGHYLNNISGGSEHLDSQMIRWTDCRTDYRQNEKKSCSYQSLESLVFWSLLGGAGGGPLRSVA